MRRNDDKSVQESGLWCARSSRSERRDGYPVTAQRTLLSFEVVGRRVLRERVVRHTEVDDRFETIEDLDGRDNASAGLADQRSRPFEGLPGIPHIVCEQHAL